MGISMDIILGKGMENITFGLLPDKIVELIGKPDKIFRSAYDEKSDSTFYVYNNMLSILQFDSDDGYKLMQMEVYNPDIRLFGKSVLGKNKRQIRYLLQKNGFNDYQYNYYGEFDSLFVEEINISIYFEFSRARSLEFGPLYDNLRNQFILDF